jgi:carboxymethylenebutenolidase
MDKTQIVTKDGACPAYVFRPSGGGPWPGVLFYMDGIGIRPALFEMGEKMAEHGYFVLLPDFFYRSGPYEPMNAKTVFSDPAQRKVLFEKYFSKATQQNVMSDTQSFLDFLQGQKDVRAGKVGVTGYCMGGHLALTAAGTYPDRIGATATYHGSRLATDSPESPHLLAPKIKSKVYVGGAIQDESFPPEAKAKLEDALTRAGVDHKIETYQARHGFVPRDTPTHDEAAEKRHWETLFALFDSTLPKP